MKKRYKFTSKLARIAGSKGGKVTAKRAGKGSPTMSERGLKGVILRWERHKLSTGTRL